MKISKKAWDSFIKRLGRLDEAAAGKVVAYMESRDYTTKEGRKNLLDYAYAIATRYGEGAAEVACQMYDAVAAASGKKLPTAEPAKTATYGEVARAVNGELLLSQEAKRVGAAVGRTVRQAGADTTAQNAVRDGAEWAWIPSGDSCSYCLMLAAQGWVRASDKVLKGTHAQHIHNNCDCTFAIRHDGRSTVEGYDPDALREQWDAAEGRTWQEKLRYLDRKKYAANRETIRKRKKAEYKARKAAKIIENKGNDGIIKAGGIFGALNDSNDPWYEKRRDHAARYYDSVRNSKKEHIVKAISANSGIDEVRVSEMLDHLFMNEYDLEEGRKRFDPSYDIAESIRRLREGTKIQKHDLTLIYHESEEFRLMNDEGMTYEEAHKEANKSYNYSKELIEWKRSNNL